MPTRLYFISFFFLLIISFVTSLVIYTGYKSPIKNSFDIKVATTIKSNTVYTKSFVEKPSFELFRGDNNSLYKKEIISLVTKNPSITNYYGLPETMIAIPNLKTDLDINNLEINLMPGMKLLLAQQVSK